MREPSFDAHLDRQWHRYHDRPNVCEDCGEAAVPEGEELCESCSIHHEEDE